MATKYYALPRQNNLDELISRAKNLSGFKTKNEILVYALQLYIEYLEKKFSVNNHSFYELTKDLAGSIEGAPDLAHNKKHLIFF
ncbi:hypothetical protein L0Z72_08350 [candidate division KSB1 bacterium]|nr:hypothetical protein [candidate division KSB1 bacterium]